MTPQQVITLGEHAITLALMLAAPLLLVGMAVGLLVALFQATTQIQEMTLTFVPKIFAVMISLFFFSSWMLIKMTDYFRNLIISIPDLVR